LLEEVDACTVFFRKIIRLHGPALNIKQGGNGREALHDFVFRLV
jgi:hypothetical protein